MLLAWRAAWQFQYYFILRAPHQLAVTLWECSVLSPYVSGPASSYLPVPRVWWPGYTNPCLASAPPPWQWVYWAVKTATYPADTGTAERDSVTSPSPQQSWSAPNRPWWLLCFLLWHGCQGVYEETPVFSCGGGRRHSELWNLFTYLIYMSAAGVYPYSMCSWRRYNYSMKGRKRCTSGLQTLDHTLHGLWILLTLHVACFERFQCSGPCSLSGS